jgi:ATP-dependent Clp protease ATP-binding subunit ClpA
MPIYDYNFTKRLQATLWLGVDTEAARNRMLTILQRGQGRYDASSAALLPFTSRSKKVLELAKEEAQALHHPLVGTEHLLLGLLAEGKGIAARVLMDSGASLEKARQQVVALREMTSDDDRSRDNEVPVGEHPAIVRVELEYMNGAIVSRQFTTTREATAFLEGDGRV